MQYYGLLHISEKARHVNLRRQTDAIRTYVNCALLCATSAKKAGHQFGLITNDADTIRAIIPESEFEILPILQHDFKLAVPKQLPFYSAHFKIEILEQFGLGHFGAMPALIDIDTVFLRPLATPAGLEVYDISEQVFSAFGTARIANDLNKLTGQLLSSPRWYGGEFIRGNAAFFSALAPYIQASWKRYNSNLDNLHHYGDEAVVSAALNLAKADGLEVADVGGANVIRWWSIRTMHKQSKLAKLQDTSILHLPADKEFLAKYARSNFSVDRFQKQYQRHAWKNIALRRLVSRFQRPSIPVKYVPEI